MTSEQSEFVGFEDSTDVKEDRWEEVIFSDAIEINNYPPAEKGDEYKSVGMADIGRNKRKIQNWEMKEYSYSRPRFSNAQTLMARITPCLENGKTAFVDVFDDDEVAIGSTEFIVLSDTEKTIPKFVYYTARRPEIRQFAIKRMTGTSGRQRVPLDIFDQKRIRIPPIEEQKKIVAILDNLDTKIETNNEITEKLEELAQTIFKSHFVDFEVYNQFKSTELGDIPRDFEVVELDSIVDLMRGYSYSSDYLDKENEFDDSYPMVNLKNVQEGGGFRSDDYKFYTEDAIKGRYHIEEGDLILAITEQTLDGELIGSPAIIPNLNAEKSIISQDLAKVLSEYVSREFLYHLFKTGDFDEYTTSMATGTTVFHLSLTAIGEYEFPLPPEDQIEKFTNIARSIHKQKSVLLDENRDLAQIRDTLLPKLMSGEIKVNDINLEDLEVSSEV